jgi:hypothetical protein
VALRRLLLWSLLAAAGCTSQPGQRVCYETVVSEMSEARWLAVAPCPPEDGAPQDGR